MTYTVFMLLSRKQGMTIEQFKDHYENKHVPLVMEALKDISPISHTRYYLKRNEAVDYDCITKIELRDEEHFGQLNHAIRNAPRKAGIKADEEAFGDKSKFRFFAVESTESTKL